MAAPAFRPFVREGSDMGTSSEERGSYGMGGRKYTLASRTGGELKSRRWGLSLPGKLLTLAPVLTLALAPTGARAHDVPAEVVVHAFVKPEGTRLRILLRAPVAAMRDVTFPQRGPGYLDLKTAQTALQQAAQLWIADSLQVFEDGRRLGPPRLEAVRASLPSDRSFESYAEALAHLLGTPLPDETEIYWNQALVDVLLDYDTLAETSRFSIDPSLERLGQRVRVALRVVPPGGAVRAFDLPGGTGLVHLDPRWHQAAAGFTRKGFLHILDGWDHLLFLLCLVIPVRRLRSLVLVVTAFTLAHSITLLASALGLAPSAAWFPPLVETLIAATLLYMALENIIRADVEHRAPLAFAFGLVHGFGFSFALRETLQFAGTHLVSSLLAFNLGIELGQLLVLAVLVPALRLVSRAAGPADRAVRIVLSALAAHTAWHWLLERGDLLRQYPATTTDGTTALLAAGLRFVLLLAVAAGAAWTVLRALERILPEDAPDPNKRA
jgi:hypothetical protein